MHSGSMLLAALLLVLISTAAQAGPGDGTYVFANLGYVTSKTPEGSDPVLSKQTLTGGAFYASVERMMPRRVFAMGLSAGYLDTRTDTTDPQINFSSTPVYFTVKAYLGSARASFNIGLGAGIQFTSFHSQSADEYRRGSVAKFALQLPIGVTGFISERVLYNLAFIPTYVADNAFAEDLQLQFYAGMGYRFGG